MGDWLQCSVYMVSLQARQWLACRLFLHGWLNPVQCLQGVTTSQTIISLQVILTWVNESSAMFTGCHYKPDNDYPAGYSYMGDWIQCNVYRVSPQARQWLACRLFLHGWLNPVQCLQGVTTSQTMISLQVILTWVTESSAMFTGCHHKPDND